MARRDEPIGSYHFYLEMDGIADVIFREVTGLVTQSEVIEERQATKSGVTYVRKLPGELKWDNIRCRRGVTTTMALWDWRKQVEQGKIDDARRNGSIVLYSPADEEVARWNFISGWPSKMSGPEFNANTNEMAIEEVEIAHEGLERVK